MTILKKSMTRRTFLTCSGKLALSAGIMSVGGLTYSSQVETEWLAVERVALPIPHLPAAAEGLKILLMSDIHLHPYTQIAFVQRAVDLAKRLQPDLVVLTGDYVLSSAEAIFELAPVLAQLNPTYGIFASIGNHDIWTDVAVVQQGLTEVGITVLRNAGVTIASGDDLLYLAGLDDGWSGQPDLQRALAGWPHGLPIVGLMHEPDFADVFARDARVSVQLSGHSHGGQVRLPGIGALELPRFGEKYDQGLYRVAEMWLYTTRGVGVIGPPVRFNCRPELTEITLFAGTHEA